MPRARPSFVNLRQQRARQRREPRRYAQGGSGTLPVLLILLMALALMQLYSQRTLVFEQRSVANQVRAAWATEAAEAGLNWALAQLNRSGSVDASCLPLASSPSGATGLRERLLRTDAGSGALAAVADVGAACVLDGSWRCSCPDTGAATLAAPGDELNHPAFSIRLQDGPGDATKQGLVRLLVTGCSHWSAGCGGSGAADARTELRSLIAPFGQLLRPPGAAITALGPVTFGAATWLVNGDADSGGLTARSAAVITADPAGRLLGPPGRPPAATLSANDPGLTGGDTFWRRHFGVARNTLRDLPTLHRVACPGGACGSGEVQTALDAGHRNLWLQGNLNLASPVQWGDNSRGLLLVVDGAATWQGALEIDALVVADSLLWQGPAAGVARLRGAVLSLGAVELQGAVEVVRDRVLLDRLRHAVGVYALVPGSWQDFVNR